MLIMYKGEKVSPIKKTESKNDFLGNFIKRESGIRACAINQEMRHQISALSFPRRPPPPNQMDSRNREISTKLQFFFQKLWKVFACNVIVFSSRREYAS